MTLVTHGADRVDARTALFNLYRGYLDNGRAIDAFLGIRTILAQDVAQAPALLPLCREAIWRALLQVVNDSDWTYYELLVRALKAAIEQDPDFWMVGETTVALSGLSLQHLLSLNRRYCARFSAFGTAFAHRPPEGPLRIGIIGCDFHAQATAYLFTGVAEAMDRSRFHLTAYDYGDYGEQEQTSDWRRRCLAAYDRFVPIAAMDDRQAAARIHADGIDILIHMRDVPNGRLGICAHRPAAIQIQYLYFPGTSGASFMDYLVADPIVVPPELDHGFAETILRLPGCYQPNDSNRELPRACSRADFGLDPGWRVMANFGQNYKITPDMFDIWCALLRADGARVLWLLEGFGQQANANLRREAALRGVDPARLIFAPKLSTADHLGRLACADIILDTCPYGGHTLTSDALWAGTPVVSLMGETFASRVPASLLAQCGVGDLAVTTAADYFARADGLLRDPAALTAKRRAIAANRARSGLFNSADYATRFGAALKDVVARRWADQSARPRDVQARVAGGTALSLTADFPGTIAHE